MRSAGVASSGGSGSHRGIRTGQAAGPGRCVWGRSVCGLSRAEVGCRQPAAFAGASSFRRPSLGGEQWVFRGPLELLLSPGNRRGSEVRAPSEWRLTDPQSAGGWGQSPSVGDAVQNTIGRGLSDSRHASLTVLEAGSPRSRRRQSWALVRAAPCFPAGPPLALLGRQRE